MRAYVHSLITWKPRFSLRWPAIVFGATLAILALLFRVLAHDGQLIYVWPITGVQLALLLHMGGKREGSLQWPLSIGAAVAALIVAGVASHAKPLINLFEAVLQGGELRLLLWFLGSHVRTFDDLKRRGNAFRLLLLATLVPALTALILLGQHPTWSGCTSVIMADSLGVAIFVPVLLLAFSGSVSHSIRQVRERPFHWTVLLLLFSVTAAIFSQSSLPILFLYFPPLILVIFMLGSEGATIAAVVTSIIACAATAYGKGPVWIAHNVPLDQRILILQLFLWATVATALPIGALLDERRVAEAHASENQTIYKTLLQNSKDMIILSRLDGSSRFVSPGVERVTGFTPLEFAGRSPLDGIHPEDRDLARTILTSLANGKADHTFRYRVMHKNGGCCWVEAYIRGYVDNDGGPMTGYVATVHDISSLKETEDYWSAEKHALTNENAHLAKLAGRDELTGIPNRRAFNRALTMEAARQNRSADFLSLLMIDVDFFKKYNDRYGHQAGDACLHKVAQVFQRSVCRLGDLAARIGGEEFAMLLPQTDQVGAVQVAQRILNDVRALDLAHEGNPDGIVTVSIGIATCLPKQQTEGAQLIQQADRALYQSKGNGRNQLSVWSGVLDLTAPEQRRQVLASA